jgi:WD40 repeat protein
MAPEQAAGKKGLTTAADVYALGAILYELLTGRSPLQGDSPADALVRLLSEEPEAPSRLRPGVPRDLETVCLKCLHKDPAQRYASAEALADDLERWLAGVPVRARPAGQAERLWRWCRRNPVVAFLAGLMVLSLLAGSAVSTYFAIQASARAQAEGQARHEAVLREREARAAQTRATEKEQQARRAQAEADRRARELGRQVYRHRLALAQREWQSNNVARAEQLLDGCDPKLRGWEWGYLKRLCHLELRTLGKFPAPVFGVAFSPTGNAVAALSDAGRARLWDARTGRVIWDVAVPPPPPTWIAHRGPALAWAFSPDGKRLAIPCWDETVQLRDAATGRPAGTLRGRAGRRAITVAYSPDGKWLAAFLQQPGDWGGVGGEVTIWEAASGKRVGEIAQSPNGAFALAFSPDGKRLAAAIPAEPVKVWDTATGKVVQVLAGHTAWVSAVAWSADGTRLISGGWDGALKLWDAATGRELRTFFGHTGTIRQAVFSRDGTRLASASDDNSTKVWETQTGQQLLTLRGHHSFVTGVAFSPDGRYLASAGLDGTVRLWDATAAHDVLTLRTGGAVHSAAFSPDGRLLAWGNGFSLSLSDPATGQFVRRLDIPHLSTAFSPDGKRLVTGGGHVPESRGLVVLWDPQSGKKVRLLGRHAGWVNAVAFSRDGTLVASASTDGVVKVWEVATARQRFAFRGSASGTGETNRLAFSPDSRRLAAAGPGHSVRIWDTATGRELLALAGHKADVVGVSYSSNGRRLASTSRDGTVRVWDAATGRTLLVLRDYAVSVAFSPDGRRIVSGGGDRTVKVWDAATGEEVLTLRGHNGGISQLAFSPDGRRIVSAGDDATARVWDGTPPRRP